MRALKCIIVDDEVHSIEGLRKYVDKVPHLEVLKSFSNPLDALDWIKDMSGIDILFLDVDMPDISGIELGSLVRGNVNKLVLTTAHTKYAYDGFRIRADDYLLKPFSLASFITVINRLFPDEVINADPLVSEISKEGDDFFFVKNKDDNLKLIKVKFSDVVAAESKLNYVQLHVMSGKSILTYMSLSEMAKYLSSIYGFIQFQRSFILNKARIESIEGNTINMDNGQKITVGDYYRKDFNEFILTHLVKGKKRNQGQ